MEQQPSNLIGICGAPGTGKTTLSQWLKRELKRSGVTAEVLPECARLLADEGVKIDKEMREPDYDRFLTAYDERDLGATAPIAIADRTPVDHMSYLESNRNMPDDFIARHRNHAYGAMERYRVVLYLPIMFPAVADGFRITDAGYREALDDSITRMLSEVPTPVHTIGEKKLSRRRSVALELARQYFPEAFPQQRMMSAGD
jgi:nicotinamide riboside kinase